MSLLKAVPPDETPENVQSVYNAFVDTVGMVPPPFEMLSASPALQSLQAKLIGYYKEGSNLSPLLMSLIRYLTASALEMQPCVEFNAKALALNGMSEEQIIALQTNPAAAPVGEKDGWLLALVIKAVRAPETLTESHVEKLKELGWTDADIMDALYISCMMVGMNVMMRALKVES
jgi:alkylhydroperoxidase family enzyme